MEHDAPRCNSRIAYQACASHARGNHGRARALCGRDPAQERITLQRETTAASGGRPSRDGVIDQRNVSFGREIPRDPRESHSFAIHCAHASWHIQTLIDNRRLSIDPVKKSEVVEQREESCAAIFISRFFRFVGIWWLIKIGERNESEWINEWCKLRWNESLEGCKIC